MPSIKMVLSYKIFKMKALTSKYFNFSALFYLNDEARYVRSQYPLTFLMVCINQNRMCDNLCNLWGLGLLIDVKIKKKGNHVYGGKT